MSKEKQCERKLRILKKQQNLYSPLRRLWFHILRAHMITSYFLPCPGPKIRFIWLMFDSFQGNQNYPKHGILKINPWLEEVGLLELIRNLIPWNAVSLWREIDEFICTGRPDRGFPLHLSKHSIVHARSDNEFSDGSWNLWNIHQSTCNTEQIPTALWDRSSTLGKGQFKHMQYYKMSALQS